MVEESWLPTVPFRSDNSFQSAHPNPDIEFLIALNEQMDVVRHEHVDRADEGMSGGYMKDELSKSRMKPCVEPAGGPILNGERPMDELSALINFAAESRQFPVAG